MATTASTQLEKEAAIAKRKLRESLALQREQQRINKIYLDTPTSSGAQRKTLPLGRRIVTWAQDTGADAATQEYAQRQRQVGLARGLQNQRDDIERIKSMSEAHQQELLSREPNFSTRQTAERPAQKETPAGPTIREVNAQPGLSREFTPEEMTVGGGPSPVLPEDERFHRNVTGGIYNLKGDYARGTRPDGTEWNPDATTMRRLNRSPKERTADEQARVNRVNQNRQMQGDAQRIASGLDRSTQAMQLYRAAEMARIKPTPTNIARHRTLAVGMEQARQTRAEQQTAGQELRADGTQQQFDNRMEIAKLDQKEREIEGKGLSKSRELKERRSYDEAQKFKSRAMAAAGARAEMEREGTRAIGEQRWGNKFATSWANAASQLGGEGIETLTKATDMQDRMEVAVGEAGNWWLPRLIGWGRSDPYTPKEAGHQLRDLSLLQRVLNGEFEGKEHEVLGLNAKPEATAAYLLDGFNQLEDDMGEEAFRQFKRDIGGMQDLELLSKQYSDYRVRVGR